MKDRNNLYRVLYEVAMHISSEEEANYCLAKLVQLSIQEGRDKNEALQTHKENLAYFAGYYSNETRERVERLFKAEHPIFGKISEKGPPTVKEALLAGFNLR